VVEPKAVYPNPFFGKPEIFLQYLLRNFTLNQNQEGASELKFSWTNLASCCICHRSVNYVNFPFVGLGQKAPDVGSTR